MLRFSDPPKRACAPEALNSITTEMFRLLPTMKLRPFLPLVLFLSLSARLVVQAQSPASPVAAPGLNQKPKSLSASDKTLLNNSMESVYLLLSLVDWQAYGLLDGSATGTVEYVKSAGKDFNAFWGELSGVGMTNGLQVPVALAGGDKSKLARLKKETGARYEKGLLEWISKEIHHLSAVLATAEKTAADPEIKQLAQKWAPVVKAQGEAAEKAEKLLGKAK